MQQGSSAILSGNLPFAGLECTDNVLFLKFKQLILGKNPVSFC
jgi:hypothetical protein